MREPKTIKGYISLMKKIETFIPSTYRGFQDLSRDEQYIINELCADISNKINEIK